MKYIISISGGKDSTACILWALNNLNKDNLEFVFLDTKWEHELVYKYLNYLENELNIKINRIESEGMLELSKRKKMMPNRVYRFCTENLKIKPFNEYIYKNYIEKNIDFIVIQGIRREESQARADTEVFAEKKETYNRKSFMVKNLYPIVDWTTKQVFEYLKQNNIEPNELYKKGFSRVGCYPCIFANKGELKLLAGDKKYLKRLRDLEAEVSEVIGKKAKFFAKDVEKHINTKSLFSV